MLVVGRPRQDGRGRTATHTREHLFRHWGRWRDKQKPPRKSVGKATGWKAGRCRHVQIAELVSIEACYQPVMDFLVATEVGKFPPKCGGRIERAQDSELRSGIGGD